jgi:hypothetical protein
MRLYKKRNFNTGKIKRITQMKKRIDKFETKARRRKKKTPTIGVVR